MFNFDENFVKKIEAMKEAGQNPYPTDFETPDSIASVIGGQDGWLFKLQPGEKIEDSDYVVGGRVKYRNRMGKIVFLRIEDATDKIQLMVIRPEMGDEVFEQAKNIDIGDWVWCRGYISKTQAGELTIHAREFKLASKIMATFPDRWNGFNDVEARSRQRYLDLMMNEESRRTFMMRSKIVREIRNFFDGLGFMEMETSLMSSIASGANAKPFITHHNALEQDFYLRVAPELNLKRLLVGGFEKVFELGNNFRNEGLSTKHLPVFTSIEWYETWTTYESKMNQIEDLFDRLLKLIGATDRIITYGDHQINFQKFERITMEELISFHTGLVGSDLRNPEALNTWFYRHGYFTDSHPTTFAKCWELIFGEFIEPKLINPTFVMGYPAEISPLARRNDSDPNLTDRFELYIAGREIANGFSELNDPIRQAEIFEEQAKMKAGGDEEAMAYDEDYITAMTFSFPPASGCGIGVDRLVMLLTNKQSIKEVVLFPTLGKKT